MVFEQLLQVRSSTRLDGITAAPTIQASGRDTQPGRYPKELEFLDVQLFAQLLGQCFDLHREAPVLNADPPSLGLASLEQAVPDELQGPQDSLGFPTFVYLPSFLSTRMIGLSLSLITEPSLAWTRPIRPPRAR